MLNDSFLNLLGLCRKAGRLSLGHDACKESIRFSKAQLMLICSDASERLTEEMANLAKENGIKTYIIKYSMLDIKQALSFKAAIITVNDGGFSKSLINKLNENKSGEERIYDK